MSCIFVEPIRQTTKTNIMVLSQIESEKLKNGLITKRLFLKVMNTIDFEEYLFRYCKIELDKRDEEQNTRETTFILFGYKATVYMQNGECFDITYKTI